MQTQTSASLTRTATRALPIPWASQAANDRLSSTLFLAALFHAIFILGVSFTGEPEPEQSPTVTNLDAVIVTRPAMNPLEPEDAELLAQRSQTGAGNTRAQDQLRSAAASTEAESAIGPEQEGQAAPQANAAQQTDRTPLIVATASDLRVVSPDSSGQPDSQPQRQRPDLVRDAVDTDFINQPAWETRITDTGERELIISANTRESRIAAYLSGWKIKVERVGTLNFPNEARSGPGTGRHPTLEVAIRADGDLEEVLIRKSSGEQVLDQAAMEILRSAAPFDPFPDFLRSDYDVLRFAYEWRFTDGADGS